MYFKLLDIVNSISCFQLAVFSFFLLHKGRKNISNVVLAFFFITQFIVIGGFLLSGIFNISGYMNLNLYIAEVPFWFLFGPLMNFYIQSLIKKDFTFRLSHLINLIPFLTGLVFILHFYLLSYGDKQVLINNGKIFRQIDFFGILMNLHVIIYNSFSLFILFSYQNNLKNYSSAAEKKNLVWLKIVLFGYLIPCFANEANSFAGKSIPVSNENQTLIIYSMFLIFFNILYYKAMLHPYVIIQPEEKLKPSGSAVDNKETRKYAERLEAYLNTKKPYLNQTLTLRDLSEATGISERNISYVINKHWNQNFFSFINSFRVEETKTLLKNANLDKVTMEGISFDAGFNSKSAFYEAFKKQTGMTPKEFRKQKA